MGKQIIEKRAQSNDGAKLKKNRSNLNVKQNMIKDINPKMK